MGISSLLSSSRDGDTLESEGLGNNVTILSKSGLYLALDEVLKVVDSVAPGNLNRERALEVGSPSTRQKQGQRVVVHGVAKHQMKESGGKKREGCKGRQRWREM
jgi:hypothetical protein